MILLAILLLPALAALLAYAVPDVLRRTILIGTAAAHLALVGMLWVDPGHGVMAGWLRDDDLGRLILSLVSVLFLALAHYAVGYLREENPRGGRAFVSCMLGFLSAASAVALAQQMALLWIGMEATTLAVAPLIYHRHDRRSLEAVWKYLVLSSVGIAFALLGVFLLATSQPSTAGRPLVVDDMLLHARALDPMWLRASFVFILIGFGTKMGLAPMHSWKPDTYGEAPSLVGGLMAGALTACAFLGLARVTSICFAADLGAFVRPPLIGFGLLSLAVAAAFIVGQADIKRLLGYSSVEHMGLLVLALGLGGTGAYAAVLHTLNNGVAKAMVFLAVGNVLLATGTPSSERVHGLLRRTPISGALLVVGLFAITGSPPFGMFISEFTIVMAAVATYPWIAGVIVVLLSIIFIGIAAMVLEMVYGSAGNGDRSSKERPWLVVAPIALAVLVLGLGVYLPGPMARALANAALVLGGHAP